MTAEPLTGFHLCRAAMAVAGITAPEQSVLTVLALMANEDAQCFPPIKGDAGLCARTKLSERAVQRAIQRLCALGHISRRQLRNGVIYTVHPRADPLTPVTQTGVEVAGDGEAPVPQAPRGDCVAPKLPITTIPSQKTSSSSKERERARDPFPRPGWADGTVWADFLVNRKRKRLANTATAHKRFLDDIERLTDAEWPPGRLLEHAVAKGWGGIYDPRSIGKAHGTSGHQPSAAIALRRQADAELAKLGRGPSADDADDFGSWLTLPANQQAG